MVYKNIRKSLNKDELRKKKGDNHLFMSDIKGKKYNHKHPTKKHGKRAFRKKK